MALTTVTLSATPTTLDPGSSQRVLVRNTDSHPVNLLNGPEPVRLLPGKEILLQVYGPVTAWVSALDGGTGQVAYDAEGTVSAGLPAQVADAIAQQVATAGTAFARKNVLDVTDPALNGGLVAKIDGSTDDTAAIAAVALIAASKGGGRVYIPGRGPTNKCHVSQLPVYPMVSYFGDGPGATWLYGTDATKSVFTVNETLGSVFLHGVTDLLVEGGQYAARLTHTNNTNPFGFPRGLLRNLVAINQASESFYLDTGAVEYRTENCHSQGSARGFRNQASDCWYSECTSQSSTYEGYLINAANCIVTNCKAFGVANSGSGGAFTFGSKNTADNCTAQQNAGPGFTLNGTGSTMTSCLADSNSGVGFNISGSDNHSLSSCHSTSGLSPYTHTAGFAIASGGGRNVSLVGCTSNGDTAVLAAGSVTTGCFVQINGIRYAGPVSEGTGSPNGVVSGSSGYYYFRTDTPSTANQRIYVCTGGTAWTALI